MASLTLSAATTVAALKSEFNAAFGATLRVYNGGKVADDSLTLGELGLSADGPFECRPSLTVDSFIVRMKSERNLKVKVYTCDNWVAVLDGLTLESAGKVKKNAVKADMESMIADQYTAISSKETAPSSANDTSAKIDAARKATDRAKVEAEAAKEELARIKAEAERAKKEAEEAKAALEKSRKEVEALKTVAEKVQKTDNKSFKDPFDGLMVRIPPGLYKEEWTIENERLVYPNGDRRRKPEKEFISINRKRLVSITYNYSICKYPVSQLQWELIMGKDNNPSDVVGDDLPITHIAFDDIQVFIKRLNQLTGKQYRLPTYAEYVWAALGATDHGRIIEERYKYDIPFKHLKECNEKGLFFYSEYEFCGDFWERRSNWPDGAVVNPLGPKEVKPITAEIPSSYYSAECKIIPPTEGLPRVLASYNAIKEKRWVWARWWTLQNVVDLHGHILFRLVLQE